MGFEGRSAFLGEDPAPLGVKHRKDMMYGSHSPENKMSSGSIATMW